jgi:hypothetical protein
VLFSQLDELFNEGVRAPEAMLPTLQAGPIETLLRFEKPRKLDDASH